MWRIFTLSLFIIHVFAEVKTEVTEEWNNFMIKYEKTYNSIVERNRRFNIFKENLEMMKKHNFEYKNGRITHRQGINQFTDWTKEEFNEYINKYTMNIEKSNKIFFFSNNSTLPESIDWRIEGAVSEIKNQGHCGSCWSFSATGAIEGQAKIKLGKKLSLSEQNLLDCSNETYGNFGCNGGNINNAFLYVNENGIQKDEDYPYIAKQGKCRQKSAVLYLSDFWFVDSNEEALKEAVAKIGPISVAIESTDVLQHYAGGILFDKTCTNHINHAVLVVGYGSENDQLYWLVKNSWGISWGEQGYFKLARNKYNNCDIATYGSYPIIK